MLETTAAIIENAIKGDTSLRDDQKLGLLQALREQAQGPKQLVTAKEASEILGCSKSMVYLLAKEGKIRRVVYSSHVIKYYAEDVEAFKYSGRLLKDN